jgi:hypothetical protein
MGRLPAPQAPSSAGLDGDERHLVDAILLPRMARTSRSSLSDATRRREAAKFLTATTAAHALDARPPL